MVSRNSYLLIIIGLIISGCNSYLNQPPLLGGGLNSRTPDEYPSFSADGRYLAFASDRNMTRSIYLYDLQQHSLIPLPNLNRVDSSQDQPALSADGRFIAYVSTERGKTDIFRYDRFTKTSQLLTYNIRNSVRHPTITGDGNLVSFESNRSGQWHIEIIDLRGK